MSFKYTRLKEAETQAKKNRINGQSANYYRNHVVIDEDPKKERKVIFLLFTLGGIIGLLMFWVGKFLVVQQRFNQTVKVNAPKTVAVVNQAATVVNPVVAETQKAGIVEQGQKIKKQVEITELNKHTLLLKGEGPISWQQEDARTLKIYFNEAMRIKIPYSEQVRYYVTDTEDQVTIKLSNLLEFGLVMNEGVNQIRITLVSNVGNMEKILIPLTTDERKILESKRIATLLEQQKEEEAIVALYQFVNEYPKAPEEREELINLLLKKGNLLKAGQVIEEGLKLFPQNLNLNKLKVQWYLLQEEQTSALALLKKLSRHPDCDQEVMAILASVAYHNGEYGLAEKTYRALINQDANNLAWWIGLGLSLEIQGKEKEAKEVYQRINANDLDYEIKEFIESKIRK